MNDSSRALATLLLLLVSVAVAGCSRAEPGLSRSDLFGVNNNDPVQVAMARPARAVAVYWPATGCFGCQAVAREAVQRAAADDSAIRVLTVVPELEAKTRPRLDLPGEVVELPPAIYAQQVAQLPPPRLEVWSRNGHDLLLLRRLPPTIEVDTLVEEIRSCLSFSSSTDSERIGAPAS